MDGAACLPSDPVSVHPVVFTRRKAEIAVKIQPRKRTGVKTQVVFPTDAL